MLEDRGRVLSSVRLGVDGVAGRQVLAGVAGMGVRNRGFRIGGWGVRNGDRVGRIRGRGRVLSYFRLGVDGDAGREVLAGGAGMWGKESGEE